MVIQLHPTEFDEFIINTPGVIVLFFVDNDVDRTKMKLNLMEALGRECDTCELVCIDFDDNEEFCKNNRIPSSDSMVIFHNQRKISHEHYVEFDYMEARIRHLHLTQTLKDFLRVIIY